MATIEERRQKLEEEITKKINELPLEIRIKALALRNYLNEKNKLDDLLEQETTQLQKTYEDMGEPFAKKSAEIISGKTAVPEESLVELNKYVKEEEKDAANAAKSASPIKDYWLKTFKSNDILSQEIKEKDEALLSHLTNLEIVKDANGKDFTLVFHFSENEFMTTNTLSKKFFMKDTDNPERTEGTEIAWKDGKNLTKKQVKKKQKNKKSGQQRVVTREVDDETFFNFFKSVNTDEKELEKLADDEEVEKIHERMDIDFEISQVLITEVYPYSLEYFLGVKEDFEDDGHGDHHDCDSHNEEEDEEEPAPKPKKKKNKKKGAKADGGEPKPEGGAAGQKPECAQAQM